MTFSVGDLLDPEKQRELNDRNKRFRAPRKVGLNTDESFARLHQLGDDKRKRLKKGFLEEDEFNVIQE